MSENQNKDPIIERIDKIEKTLRDEIEARKELARALIKIADKLEEHTKGGMSIEELQSCLNKVNELVSTLQSAGIGLGGEGNGNLLAQVLAYQKMQERMAGDTSIQPISSSKSKKLKKLLEEEDEDEESSEDKK